MSETSQANEGCQRRDYYVVKEQETHYSEENAISHQLLLL
jgi:hypothetical protein